jgi:hypothetical protein
MTTMTTRKMKPLPAASTAATRTSPAAAPTAARTATMRAATALRLGISIGLVVVHYPFESNRLFLVKSLFESMKNVLPI